MLFANSSNRFRLNHNHFTDNLNISFGILEMIKVGKKILPYTQSAIDKNKSVAYLKAYNEYLERVRIGFNGASDGYVDFFNLLTSSVGKTKREYLGYGANEAFGMMDTTGSASGLSSDRVIQKAKNELIEKNELLLLWYKKLGFSLEIDDGVLKTIESIGFASKQIFLFACNSILDSPTFVVILFNDENTLTATGVSFGGTYHRSFIGALYEAKLLERINLESTYSPYAAIRPEEHNDVYQYVCLLRDTLPKRTLANFVETEDATLPHWLTSLNVALLNTKGFQRELTVRCFSSDLLNCIPLKDNIEHSHNNTIIREYSILYDLGQTPNCLVV